MTHWTSVTTVWRTQLQLHPLPLPDPLADAEEAEALEADEEEPLDDELEHGSALLVPSSATIMVQRNRAGEPRSYSAHRRTTVCGRTKCVASLFSKKLVAVTTLRRGSPEG